MRVRWDFKIHMEPQAMLRQRLLFRLNRFLCLSLDLYLFNCSPLSFFAFVSLGLRGNNQCIHVYLFPATRSVSKDSSGCRRVASNLTSNQRIKSDLLKSSLCFTGGEAKGA